MIKGTTFNILWCRTLLSRILSAALFCMPLAWAATVVAASSNFSGVITTQLKDSVPDWPDQRLPPRNSPNVLIWMIDDAGFAHLGGFGGIIETPNIDRLAKRGLRFSNFHTAPVCSASRAALLTGRNPHRVHVGAHAGAAIGFPGYDAHIPDSMGTIADALGQTGYSTFAIGKWDHLPTEDTSPAGPFDYWPSGQGFDHFYGFLAADTDNFNPTLWSDHTPINIPKKLEGYHLSKDMADKAIQFIDERTVLPTRPPFLMYWASGAVHAPHHAPRDMIEHYHGRFDAGWDTAREQILSRQKEMGIVPETTTLSPRPEGMEAWADLSAAQQKSYARAMEVFAAQLTYTDQQFGRILDFLEETGELDNTLVIVVSDNGASAEGAIHGTFSEHMFFNGQHPSVEDNLGYYDLWGGPETYPHIPMGWAVVGNTPFRYYKQTAFEGGSRVPMIISWPAGIEPKGEVRSQYHFITDILPTILSATRISAPTEVDGVAQASYDGIDMSYTFNFKQQPSRRKTQYIEKFGDRAIYQDGWKAVTMQKTNTWEVESNDEVKQVWELYHLDHDLNELNDVALIEPEKLQSLVKLFDEEARANNVYPLVVGDIRKVMTARSASVTRDKQGLYVYRTPISRIPEAVAPPVLNTSFVLDAQVTIEDGQAASTAGPIFAVGGQLGGMTLFASDGHLSFLFRDIDNKVTRIDSSELLKPGKNHIRLSLQRSDRGASVSLTNNSQLLGKAEIPQILARIFSLHETFDVGSDSGGTVAPEYATQPVFTGDLNELRVQIILPRK